MKRFMSGRRYPLLALALVAAVPLSSTPSVQAGFIRAVANISTDNCNDPANANTAAPAGLCQANNPTQPGGNNPQFITATVFMTDNGQYLTATGTGSGFIFGRTYVSLLYLNPTVQTCSRFPKDQPAQTVNVANADNDFNSMFIGFWDVRPDGTGVLAPTTRMSPQGNILQPGSVRGLSAYFTTSVREAAGGFLSGQTNNVITNVTGGADVPPNIFALRACGANIFM